MNGWFGGSGSGTQTITKMDATDVEAGTISDDMVVLDEAAVDGTAIDTSAPTPLPGTGTGTGTGPVAPKAAPVLPDSDKQPASNTPSGGENGPATPGVAPKSLLPVAPAPAQKTAGDAQKSVLKAPVKQPVKQPAKQPAKDL